MGLAAGAREALHRRFLADEIASALRHRLTNKIAAIGALTFHLKQKLAAVESEEATRILPMIDAELAQASQTLGTHFLEAPEPPGDPVSLASVVAATLLTAEPPAHVTVENGSAAGGPRVSVEPRELDLALACLLENAYEALAERGGLVSVRVLETVASDAAVCGVEISDDGPGMSQAQRHEARNAFFSTKPGHLGVGLNVVARIAQRWRGWLELEDRALQGGKGLNARIIFPAERP
jgi:signal transduction histidine kinase